MSPVKAPRSKAAAWVLGALLGAGVWPASCASAPARKPPDAAAGSLAIVDVTLLPVPDGRLAEHQTVLIEGESIVRVGPAASTALPPGTSRVDGRGRFLMPGMADMHVHLPDDPAGQELARISLLLVANGVTTIRSMKGAPSHLRFRDSSRSTWTPTLILGGPPVAETLDAGQARALVREQKAAGYDFIKLLGGFDRPAYDALADEARRAGLPVCGHVPAEIGLDAALGARQASIEHLTGYTAVVKTKADAMNEDELGPRTREAGVWNCPTLDFYGVMLEEDGQRLEGRDGLEFATEADRQSWRKDRAANPPQDGPARLLRLQGIVAALARAGGKILVGSDTPGPYRVPGFSYLEELRRLQEAGLSRAEILRAATQGAAEYLGASSRGRIAPGHQADLVLLEANPLDDLAHLARPAGVVVRGRFLSREAAGILIEELRPCRARTDRIG